MTTRSSNPANLKWHLYMIRTSQGTLYTGITQDVDRRFMEHQQGGKKTAKYLRGKGPLELVFQQEIGNKSTALKAEIEIKKLSKLKKETLAKNKEKLNLDILKPVPKK
jgi:putative endonuclease